MSYDAYFVIIEIKRTGDHMALPHDKYFLSLADPVARYMNKSGRRPNCTPEEILDLAKSSGELVSWNFTCLAYLKEEDFYLSWSEVPKPPYEGMYASIRKGRTVERFMYQKNRWVNMGGMSDDMYY
jgi:hypothetical protein